MSATQQNPIRSRKMAGPNGINHRHPHSSHQPVNGGKECVFISTTYPILPPFHLLTPWQLMPKSLPITLFLATVIIETIVDLALQGDIYLRLHSLAQSDNSSRDQARRISVYLAIFALAQSVFAFTQIDCFF